MITLSNFINTYIDCIIPDNFIKNFNSDDEFKEWLRKGSEDDLQCALSEFEQSELFEYCELIIDVLNEK